MNSPNIKFIISENESGERLDKFLQSKLSDYSRSSIQNFINKKNVLVNNQSAKTGYKTKIDDEICLNIPEQKESDLTPEAIPLDIIYEDEFLIVINKPSGLVVHPGAGNFTGTLVNALLHHCNTLSSVNGNLRPGIVHRLDKNTSGLLVVAKDDKIHQLLQKQFDTKDIFRIYIALVWGRPVSNEGEIDTHISRSRRDRKKMAVSEFKGKQAITTYKLIKDYQYLSVLELHLKTGRTHQIRVHLNHISLPVFGDPVYNGRKSQLRRLPSHLQKRGMALLKSIDRQALHAKKLSFIHPIKNERMEFESDLPEDMEKVIGSINKTLMLDD